jgi:hypothetical protein
LVDRMWPTPTAKGGSDVPGRKDHEKSGSSLQKALNEMWPTPVVTDSEGTRNATADRSPGKKFQKGETLGDTIYFLPDGEHPLMRGKTGRPMLNPRFCEGLMGWPLGWTSTSEQTDLGASATEWSRWLQLSLSALSRLVL